MIDPTFTTTRIYSWLSLSRTRKGPDNLLEIERVRDRERKIGYSLHKGTETLVPDRERFEIEGVRDKESQLYFQNNCVISYATKQPNNGNHKIITEIYQITT